MNVYVCHCHDAIDQGSQTLSGLSEWELTDKINEAMADVVRAGGHLAWRLEVTLQARIDGINTLHHGSPGTAIAVETHLNHIEDKKRNGFFVMAWYRSREGVELAESIIEELSKIRPSNMGLCMVAGHRRWSGTNRAFDGKRLDFLQKTVCPAVIPEVCYLSNPREAEWITDPKNQAAVGVAIGEGIINFLNER